MDSADDLFYSTEILKKLIEKEEHAIDYLVIIDGILLDEKDAYESGFYRREHRKIIRGIRKHTKESARLSKRLARTAMRYAIAKRKEGW